MATFRPDDRVLPRDDPREAWTVIGYHEAANTVWLKKGNTTMLAGANRFILAPLDWEDRPVLPPLTASGPECAAYDNAIRRRREHHQLPLLRRIEEEGR